MTGIAFMLAGFALADLLAGGLSGQPRRNLRMLWGLLAGVLVVWLFGIAHGYDCNKNLLSAGFGLIAFGGWLFLKTMNKDSNPTLCSKIALIWLSLFLLATLLMTPLWPSTLDPRIDEWLQRLPMDALENRGSTEVFVYVSVLLFLSAPANAIVRLCLTAAGTDWKKSEGRIRGGRLIGVLERWLIFGLATAGEPTAAALIVSAKSILRFPELNRAGRGSDGQTDKSEEVDSITEYFLLGSLLSWTIALALAALFI